jgi:hypothetical protein
VLLIIGIHHWFLNCIFGVKFKQQQKMRKNLYQLNMNTEHPLATDLEDILKQADDLPDLKCADVKL